MALFSRVCSGAKRLDILPAGAWCANRGLSDIARAFDDIPTTVKGGAAFESDLKSVSGLGVGDGIKTHTGKWLQGDRKSPMQYVSEVEPKKVKGLVVACRGSDHPSLGAPVSYLDLRGSTFEKPVTCKYTGYKYYSDDWKEGGAH